jgi:hypothetical protein
MLTLLISSPAREATAQETPATRSVCVDVRPFLGGGRRGCRVAVTEGPARMCIKQEGERYEIAFKTEKNEPIKTYLYDSKISEGGLGHREIFYRTSKGSEIPEVRIGLSESVSPGASVLLIGKSRHCLPESAVRELLK